MQAVQDAVERGEAPGVVLGQGSAYVEGTGPKFRKGLPPGSPPPPTTPLSLVTLVGTRAGALCCNAVVVIVPSTTRTQLVATQLCFIATLVMVSSAYTVACFRFIHADIAWQPTVSATSYGRS